MLMLGVTHVLFGLLVGTTFSHVYGPNANFLFFAALGAVFPDIDHPKSLLGRFVQPVGWFSQHRGFLHSLLGGVAFTIVLFLLADMAGHGPLLPLAFLVGFISHLFLDGSTKRGVYALWPAKLKFSGRRKVGSLPEKVLQVVIVVFLVWYWAKLI